MLNTLSFSKKLIEAGVPRKQAEAHMLILSEMIETNLATKQDIKELEYRLVIKLGLLVISAFTVTIATLAIILKTL